MQPFEMDGPYYSNSSWTLITSKVLPDEPLKATILPPLTFSTNDFANASLAAVFNFVRNNRHKLEELQCSVKHWLIIDQAALDQSTYIIACQCDEDDISDKGERLKNSNRGFRPVRLPFNAVYLTFKKLDSGALKAEDVIDVKGGMLSDGTYYWSQDSGIDFSDPSSNDGWLLHRATRKRVKAIQAMQTIGHYD